MTATARALRDIEDKPTTAADVCRAQNKAMMMTYAQDFDRGMLARLAEAHDEPNTPRRLCWKCIAIWAGLAAASLAVAWGLWAVAGDALFYLTMTNGD